MNLFCVFLKRKFARDTQIFNGKENHIVSDEEVKSESGSIYHDSVYDDCWKDAEFDLLIGIYSASDVAEAVEMAANENYLDKRTLDAIQTSGN